MTFATPQKQPVIECLETLLEKLAVPRQRFETGGSVIEPDGPDALAYVHRGRLLVYQVIDAKRRRLTRVIGPGEWTGVDALATNAAGTTQVVAAEASIVSLVPASDLLESIADDHICAVWLLRAVAAVAADAERDAALVAFDDCRTRLIGALKKFSDSAAATQEADGVRLRLTHAQLADAIGAARETVSLMLSDLRRAGIVRTGRNHLMIDMSRLHRYSLPGDGGTVFRTIDTVTNEN